MINSKKKGKTGELEFCQWLREMLGLEARRGVQYKGDKDAPDVITSLEGVHFEVKRTESLNIYKAMKQAIGDAGDHVPVVAHRRSREDWLLILKAEDIVKLCKAIGTIKPKKKKQNVIMCKPIERAS